MLYYLLKFKKICLLDDHNIYPQGKTKKNDNVNCQVMQSLEA